MSRLPDPTSYSFARPTPERADPEVASQTNLRRRLRQLDRAAGRLQRLLQDRELQRAMPWAARALTVQFERLDQERKQVRLHIKAGSRHACS